MCFCGGSNNYSINLFILQIRGKVYGMLSVSIPRAIIADEEEQSLVKEIASDIAFALHSIELEEERKRMEQALQKRNKQLIAQQQELIEKTAEVENVAVSNDLRMTWRIR